MTWEKQFKAWIESLCRYGHEPLRYVQWDQRQSTDGETTKMWARVFTDRYSYSISAGPNYLGCIMSARKARAGETWTRGSDLPDGKFSEETWQKIVLAIVSYELVELEGKPTPKEMADEVPDQPREA